MSRSSDCEKIIRRYSGKVDERKSDEQSTPSSEVLAKRESPREELRRTFALNNSVEDFIESPTDTMAEQTPNIMIFREVAEPSNKVGDMYELSWEGKKTVVVNFDFKICGYLGESKSLNISFSIVIRSVWITADRILICQFMIMSLK